MTVDDADSNVTNQERLYKLLAGGISRYISKQAFAHPFDAIRGASKRPRFPSISDINIMDGVGGVQPL